MNHDIFQSRAHYDEAFADGLEAMLAHDGLGVFILVSANAMMGDGLRERLWPLIEQRYQQTFDDYRARIHVGHTLPDNDDDVIVFLKMALLGMDDIEPVAYRNDGPWQIQYNHMRSFRPARMAHQRVEGISAPFNPQGFHFNKPFLRKEAFWQGTLAGVEVELLYNKFPLVEGHGLLVPEREQAQPQLLTERMHHFVWTIAEEQGALLPLGISYNSYGAYASVNHLHFQTFVRSEPLPVESPLWQHNGGGEAYPVEVMVFDNSNDAWQGIEALHSSETPYNLLYRAGKLYSLPRKRQGDYQHSDWSVGYAWYEMCGAVVTFCREDYLQIDGGVIGGEFERLRV